MELNEKLQMLRKKKGLTQQELADRLYVSRTTVSKWESGRGVPGIESLKAISNFFSVSLDELLSTKEMLILADHELTENRYRRKIKTCAFLGIGVVSLLFLPLFGQQGNEQIEAVSLLHLTQEELYIRISYLLLIFLSCISGILLLSVKNDTHRWEKICYTVSITISYLFTLLLILSRQPYACFVTLSFLVIKLIQHQDMKPVQY